MRTAGTMLAWSILWLVRAGAHQELYHNVDVRLIDTAETGVVEISFTVHAPELFVGFEEAADAMYDDRWLRERSDAQLERIVALARDFLADRFAVRVGDDDAVNIGERLFFDEPGRMRGEAADQLPPACLLATLKVKLPPDARELQFKHSADSEKRLMLVVLRPGAFPEVLDVEAGSIATVALPELRGGKPGWFYAAIVAAMLAAMAWLQARRGMRKAQSMGPR